jgi:hypothetical protein
MTLRVIRQDRAVIAEMERKLVDLAPRPVSQVSEVSAIAASFTREEGERILEAPRTVKVELLTELQENGRRKPARGRSGSRELKGDIPEVSTNLILKLHDRTLFTA